MTSLTMPNLILSVPLLLAHLPALAAVSGEIEELYEEHCVRCHGPEVYTRSDRKVTSLEGLQRQVQRCELALGLRWFDEEIAEMAEYLDRNYYQFSR
jgi:hypothetical protein